MNNRTKILGWDLGGAHLKAVLVDAQGVALHAVQLPCPLWRGLEFLQHAISEVLEEVEVAEVRHAVTMTGELADIFFSRAEGVRQLSRLMFQRFGSDAVRVYAGPEGFVDEASVERHLASIASANWHASASFLASAVADGLLIDIGSTTTDIIPLQHGAPRSMAMDDAGRMRYDELVYTGVVRTAVMAVTRRVPFDGAWQGVAAELFATMADVYRLTGDLPEGCDMADTADGAGKSIEESARRLARMVGRDLEDATIAEWRTLAAAIKSQQMAMLTEAVERQYSRGLLGERSAVIGAGTGRFLARELARRMELPYRDAAEFVEALPAVHDWSVICLPAYAVAREAMREGAWRS